MTARTLHLNINVNSSGRHPASWRAQRDPLAFLDPAYYETIGRLAERGRLDAVFFSDGYDYGAPKVARPWQAFDPLIPLTAVARATSHVGLVATVSSTFNHPVNIARRIASLDHISGGRAAWNVVATRAPDAARLFGMEALPDHDTRYARADEVVQAVRALWDGWDEDALVADQASGRFADPSKIHPVAFHGAHVDVEGVLNVPRSPQGRPVILQAGGSPQGVALAAKHADAVFCVNHTIEAAREFYADVKDRAAAYGRAPEQVLILPGLFPILGATEREAWARKDRLDELAGTEGELAALAGSIGLAPEDLSLDAELPWDKLNALPPVPGSQGFRTAILDLADRERLTVRELLRRNPAGHRSVVGTPEQVADTIEDWFTTRAADGFNLNTDYFPEGLEMLVDLLVPELQRRGLFRTEYAATTLRGNLGLTTPRARRSGPGRAGAAAG